MRGGRSRKGRRGEGKRAAATTRAKAVTSREPRSLPAPTTIRVEVKLAGQSEPAGSTVRATTGEMSAKAAASMSTLAPAVGGSRTAETADASRKRPPPRRKAAAARKMSSRKAPRKKTPAGNKKARKKVPRGAAPAKPARSEAAPKAQGPPPQVAAGTVAESPPQQPEAQTLKRKTSYRSDDPTHTWTPQPVGK